jgi:outer membrane protein TolC
LAALALLAAPAQAQQRLTLEEAQEMAARQSSYNKLAGLRVKEQEHKRDALRAHQFPELRTESNLFYSLERQRIELPAGSLGALPGLGPFPPANLTLLQGLNSVLLSQNTLGQPVTQLVKIRAGVRAASQDVAIAEQEAARIRAEVDYKVAEAFYGILILERRLAAARKRLEAAADAAREARDAVETGAALAVKSMEADALRLQAGNTVLAAELALEDARAEFNDLVGLAPDAKPELAAPAGEAPSLGALDEWVREAQERSAEVRGAAAAVEKARAGVRAAQAEFIPELSLYAQHIWQSGVPFIAQNNGLLGARLTWSVFDWGKRKAAVDERRTQLAQAEENLRRLRARAAVETEKTYRKAVRLADLGRAAGSAVALRREARRIQADQAELGLATPRTAREAEAAALEAESQQLEAELGLRLAVAELYKVTGRPKTN